ncbi:ejaculatory bulb-specific protein 3-like [Ochlerotatus camptorhynchus]|uniref:ejaculatory bulb-specific protein 3-like n=1 Tax=Ochlerotatus camptorhynchus TaxID=644619 RepID=UPI0031D42478
MKCLAVALALIAMAAAQNESMNYYNCLTDAGPCTPEGNELKRVLPEALETNCAKCSQKQHESGTRAIKYATENILERFCGLALIRKTSMSRNIWRKLKRKL